MSDVHALTDASWRVWLYDRINERGSKSSHPRHDLLVNGFTEQAIFSLSLGDENEFSVFVVGDPLSESGELRALVTDLDAQWLEEADDLHAFTDLPEFGNVILSFLQPREDLVLGESLM